VVRSCTGGHGPGSEQVLERHAALECRICKSPRPSSAPRQFSRQASLARNRHDALNQALADLQAVGLVESSSYGWRLLDAGERALKDEVAHWSSVGHFSLTDARMAILELIGRQSQHEAADYAQVDWVDIGSVLQQLRWPEAELRGESRVLLDNGLIAVRPASGHFRVTYLGLVTVTRGEAIAARARTLRWPALTNRQRQVLFTLVDWERATPGTGDFILRLSIAGAYFVGHQDARIERSDLEQLGAKGYLHVRQPPKRGGLMVSLTAEGHAFYEDHQREHQPAEQLAARVRQYVDTAAAAVYPDAVARLGEAADALWSARHDPDVTSVGFTCREALQSFALAYYARFYPRAQDEPIAKENTRRLG